MLIRNLTTSGDVIHRWTIPALGLKTDAIPGRLNQLRFNVSDKNCFFFGQCSELCGVNHRFIPIRLKSCSNYFFFFIFKTIEKLHK